jgi:hypothetical protein
MERAITSSITHWWNSGPRGTSICPRIFVTIILGDTPKSFALFRVDMQLYLININLKMLYVSCFREYGCTLCMSTRYTTSHSIYVVGAWDNSELSATERRKKPVFRHFPLKSLTTVTTFCVSHISHITRQLFFSPRRKKSIYRVFIHIPYPTQRGYLSRIKKVK